CEFVGGQLARECGETPHLRRSGVPAASFRNRTPNYVWTQPPSKTHSHTCSPPPCHICSYRFSAAGFLSSSFSDGTAPVSGTVTVTIAVRPGRIIPKRACCASDKGTYPSACTS